DVRAQLAQVDPAECAAQHPHRTAGGVAPRAEDAEQRRLAGAVGAEQRPVLARPDHHADLVEEGLAGADQVHPVGFDDGLDVRTTALHVRTFPRRPRPRGGRPAPPPAGPHAVPVPGSAPTGPPYSGAASHRSDSAAHLPTCTYTVELGESDEMAEKGRIGGR